MDDEFGNYKASLTKAIENTRLLETTVAEIHRLATKFTLSLEEKSEDEVSENELDKLRESIMRLCPVYACELYLSYEGIYRTYYTQTVLPCVKNKHGEEMLHELLHRWNNHKKMVSYLANSFGDLAKFAAKTSDKLPKTLLSHVVSNRKQDGRYAATLEDLALASFRDHLLLKIVSEATSAIMKMVAQDRHGVQIDEGLLKSLCGIYTQNGLETYERCLERSFLQDTESYYSCKASSWIVHDSFPDYLLKLEESLEKEKERVAHYLHSSTEPKLVEVVLNEFLVSVENQLLEKEKSGCCSFLRDEKKDDLSRMFRIYHAFPQRLKPLAEVFRLHITTKMNALMQQAKDALTSSAPVEDKVFVGSIAGLHNEYFVYLTDCFQNHSSFLNSFTNAFVTFCRNKVDGRSIRQRLGTFCENLCKETGDIKMDDLSKVYKLYHTISLPLGPVPKVFSSYVTREVKAFIQRAEYSAATGSLDGQVFVRQILELHAEQMNNVRVFFQNHSLFLNAVKEAFKIFYSEEVAGSPSALLLASYCEALLKKAEGDDKLNDISKIFRLYDAISKGLDPVAKALRLQVTAQGNALIEQANDALTTGGSVEEQALALVRDIFGLHDKYFTNWFHEISSSSLLIRALKTAFEIFCNKTVGGRSFAELLANFCDNLLNKAGKAGNDDSTFESTIDTVVELLEFTTNDRDLFGFVYWKKLGDRLIRRCSFSDVHERSIVTKLKGRFGAIFTYKMERMLADMALAEELNEGYMEYMANDGLIVDEEELV